MNQEQLDKIREKLYDFQMPVDAEIWRGINASLRRKRGIRLLYWASSVAAAAVAALIIFTGIGSEPEINLVAGQLPVNETTVLQEQQPEQETVLPQEKEPVDIIGQQSIQHSVLQLEQQLKQAVAPQAVLETEVKEMVADAGVGSPMREDTMPQQQEEKSMDGIQEQERKILYQMEMEEESSAGKYSLSVNSGLMPGSSASVAGSAIRATSAGAGSISQSYMVEQISDTHYSLPLNLGLQMQLPLKHNMALGVGVNYTMLKSSYDCLINKKNYNVKQTLHYIGIPVNVYGLVVDKNRFRFYVNAGATIEKGIRAVYHLKSYDEALRSSSSIDGLQFSVNAGMGVEYSISNVLGLYLEPNIVYYMDSDVPRSIRTDQPLQVKAEMGFRFRF